ncbi:hypothetical protein VTO42DRAFT_2736 [Malbranchea cinnamomea]
MDFRTRFSRKHSAADGEDRGRRRNLRDARAQPGDGHSKSLDVTGLAPLVRQTSAASATAASRPSSSQTLTRHRSVQSDGRSSEDRRSFAQKLNLFRPLSASTSRASSVNTSSSSLLSLAEQAGAGEAGLEGAANPPVSGHPHASSTARAGDPTTPHHHHHHQQQQQQNPPLSPLSEVPVQSAQRTNDLPVYPDQSYAVLQQQVHPTYHSPPGLRTRSSYPSQYPLSISTASTWNQGSSESSQTSRTVGNTPLSSPGLFSPRAAHSMSQPNKRQSPLHPTYLQEPKETHTLEVDRDTLTGNKLINEYEILDELGRGEHGKVKLGRHVRTGQKVAIKIVQRYSKRRRLGKLGNPEDKVKKEVAILKKARHPNVVSLLEVIDDPNRQKVYIVLEYVENGEIMWRKKGLKEIITVDKKRLEREKNGIPDSPSFMEESKQLVRTAQARRRKRQASLKRQREKASLCYASGIPAWSLEHGAVSDDEVGPDQSDLPQTSTGSVQDGSESVSQASTSVTSASELERRMRESALAAVEGSMYGAYSSDFPLERRYSTASSNFYQSEPDWLSDDDDLAYVPVLTMSEARSAFRDAVLGLEYLHYQGIIHRDIKPANLLMTANHQIKISDFGVSYLGRPIRDDDEEQVEETDATELDDARELSKTVGTPAFYAPELCYTGTDFEKAIGKVPKITGAIDVWSLGVTLYGMIFGRLPFVADDEFGLFHIIVNKPVFIPTKRLKPVELSASPAQGSSPQLPVINSNKRTEEELVYEDIDDDLRDLLLRLLEKDPTKRITLKEIKHHPWVLRDIADPTTWPEETDPAYQSKGKKIEVSNEEVTQAVTKMPFIERVRSNVARWGGSLFGRGKEARRRAPSTTASVDTPPSASSSSSVTLGKELIRELRRSSLRGDEEPSRTPKAVREREGDHPLSHSVVPSPDAKEGRDYFGAAGAAAAAAASANAANPPLERGARPELPDRTTSAVSTTESVRTLRPRALRSDSRSTAKPEPTQQQQGSSAGLGSLLGGAGRKLVRSLQHREGRRERSPASDRSSVNDDVRSGASVAVTATSVTGQVQPPEALRDSSLDTITRTESQDTAHPPVDACHLQSRSRQHVSEPPVVDAGSSRPQHHHRGLENGGSSASPILQTRGSTEPAENDHGLLRDSLGRVMTSRPSTVTISSSSADDFTSGMSYCPSHPSIPSVVSGASSFSGDTFQSYIVNRDKEKDGCELVDDVPRLLRTEDTVTVHGLSPTGPDGKAHHDDYDCDDEDEGESSDEGIVFGRKRSSTQASATT